MKYTRGILIFFLSISLLFAALSLKASKRTDTEGVKIPIFIDAKFLDRYGFKKGDVIKEINGEKVKTIKETISICRSLEERYLTLETPEDVNVLLARDGKDMNIDFQPESYIPEKVYYTMRLEKRIGK